MAESRDASLALLLPGGERRPLPAKGAWIVGSDATCDLVVTGEGVAARHLTLAPLKSGGFGVKVMDEQAETRLNGQKVRSARLEKGDRLQLGTQELVVVAPKSSKAALAAAARARAAEDPGRLPQLPGLQVERVLGRGSNGTVYLAVQENLQRKVAVKLLSKKLSQDAAFVQRFLDEARAAAALHHANVATVFDVGEHEGRPFLLMEYMDQGSVEDRLAQNGQLPWRAVLGILRDAAAGLEYAESKGIVHRDIKPANLMQTSGGGTKIVDLGLAAPASEETGGKIQGTPHFMPPEQARGEAVDTRADLYALGASAWRMLTGETPFQGSDARAILRAVQEEPLPDLDELVDDVPAGVRALVIDLLRKDPDARPRSAAAVRERVEQLMNQGGGGGSAAGGYQPKSRAPKAIVSLVVAVALLAGVFKGLPLILGSGDDEPGGSDPAPVVIDDGSDDSEGASGPPALVQDTGGGANAAGGSDEGQPESAGDAELAAMEAEASSALELVTTLSDAQAKRTALLELAATYPGTTAATLALEQARELGAQLASGEGQLGGAAGNPSGNGAGNVLEEGINTIDPLANLVAEWTALVESPTGELEPPQVALDKLGAYSPLAGSLSEAQVSEALTEFRASLMARYGARQSAVLEQAYADIAEGRFEVADGNLREHYAWLMIPGPSADVEEAAQRAARERAMDPLEVAEGGLTVAVRHLRSEIESTAAVIAALPEYEQRLEDYLRQGDRLVLAQACAPGGALRSAWNRLDGGALAAQWSQLEGQVQSRFYAERLAEQRLRAEQAGRAWAALQAGFDAGQWRRTSIQLPNERRGVADVIGVFADGLSVQGDGGPRTYEIPQFAGDPGALDSLFFERLNADWQPQQRAQIAALVELASAQAALARFEAQLPTSGLPDADRDVRDAFEGDVEARVRWRASGAPDPEARAIEALAAVLAALSEQRYDSAAFALEELLHTHTDQPLVWCLWQGEADTAAVQWPPRPDEL
ncbi:MAG: protein kinase domain-containing protein [Planctomycetota bacterium]